MKLHEILNEQFTIQAAFNDPAFVQYVKQEEFSRQDVMRAWKLIQRAVNGHTDPRELENLNSEITQMIKYLDANTFVNNNREEELLNAMAFIYEVALELKDVDVAVTAGNLFMAHSDELELDDESY